MSEITKQSIDYLATQQQTELFDDLLQQLRKDIRMAGIDTDEFEKIHTARDLVEHLGFFIEALITNHGDLFNNLMYRIDISEKHMNSLDFSDMRKLIDQLSYFIIKREGQKVYFRKQF